jgi:hypothetical protein
MIIGIKSEKHVQQYFKIASFHIYFKTLKILSFGFEKKEVKTQIRL